MKDFDAGYLSLLHCPKCGWSGPGKPVYITDRPYPHIFREYLNWKCTRCGYTVTSTNCVDAAQKS